MKERMLSPHEVDKQLAQRVEVSERLAQLAKEANLHYRRGFGAWVKCLRHARESGKRLNEAKKLTGGRRKWTQWRTQKFDGSAETARVYMRIARNWDHPRIVEARQNGIAVDSITTFLKVLKGQKLDAKKYRPKQDSEKIKELKRAFALKLGTLSDMELHEFYRGFESDVWPEVYQELCRTVAWEWSYTYPETEEARRIANEKILNARQLRKQREARERRRQEKAGAA